MMTNIPWEVLATALVILIGGIGTAFGVFFRAITKKTVETHKVSGAVLASISKIDANQQILTSKFDRFEVGITGRVQNLEERFLRLEDLLKMDSDLKVALTKLSMMEKEIDGLRILKHQMQNDMMAKQLRAQLADLKSQKGE